MNDTQKEKFNDDSIELARRNRPTIINMRFARVGQYDLRGNLIAKPAEEPKDDR